MTNDLASCTRNMWGFLGLIDSHLSVSYIKQSCHKQYSLGPSHTLHFVSTLTILSMCWFYNHHSSIPIGSFCIITHAWASIWVISILSIWQDEWRNCLTCSSRLVMEAHIKPCSGIPLNRTEFPLFNQENINILFLSCKWVSNKSCIQGFHYTAKVVLFFSLSR